jgi:UDP-N-acetylglucosamine 2-epimerase (non-hydrolysing)
MEAGNRCFDQRVPEETNRKIVDHISDINLTYSNVAREYLLREGLSADRIIKTGSPMFEVLNHYLDSIKKSDVLNILKLEQYKYFVVSAHREENINNEANFNGLITSLNLIAAKYDLPIIVSTHPRTRKMIDAKGIKLNNNVILLKPLGFNDYNALQMNAKAVISDSGTISEESSILNFPALNIRQAHERPEAMEEASVMMVGLNAERILQGLIILENQKSGESKMLRKVADYTMPNVSEKVVRIIISYVDYIKRTVWAE